MNKEILYAIITGVVSGILTAIFVWMIHKFFIQVFTPWFEERVYKGIIVEGVWIAVIDTKHEKVSDNLKKTLLHRRNLTLNLFQKGNCVKGSFYAKSDVMDESGKLVEDRKYNNQYLIKGYIKNNYLILNYDAISKNRTGLGSFTLKVTNGGSKMNGGMAFVVEGSIDIVSTIDSISFTRS